jgi:hypothetical protein
MLKNNKGLFEILINIILKYLYRLNRKISIQNSIIQNKSNSENIEIFNCNNLHLIQIFTKYKLKN